MIRLFNIINEQDTDFDANRTTDPTSKPQEKLNVLFIGDGDTHSEFSYAKDILNSGVITGNVVSTKEGDIRKLLSLLQTHVASGYDIVSLMFSNTTPNLDVSSIEILKNMYNIIKDTGAKLVTISPPTKDFAPYGHVKYANTKDIANWMNAQQQPDFNIDAYDLIDRKIFFEKNKILLNKEAHGLLARLWLRYLSQIDTSLDSNVLDKKDAKKKQQGAKSELSQFKQGDSSPNLEKLQRRLNSLDYKIAKTEMSKGSFGDSTYLAVKSFQLINEMPITGYIDENTARAILSKDARTFSNWASLFGLSSFANLEKELDKFETSDSEETTSDVTDYGPVSVTVTTGNYQTSYSDDIATQAAAILRREEGMILEPMWDVDNWRIGFGSSTITKSDGTVVKLSNNKSARPAIKITAEDAERDLKRRLRDEFIPHTKRTLGSIASSFNAGTIAALTSVSYNYGTVPSSVVRAAQGGNVQEIANAVAALGERSPIHKGRRNREASWILGSAGLTGTSTTTTNTSNKPIGKSIVIGDSLTPNVARAAGINQGPKASSITVGDGGLWYGGITVGTLAKWANEYPNTNPDVKNVVITIGTNGIFARSTNTINSLVKSLRAKFPNAKILVVKGTYGSKITWSKPLMNVSQKTVDAFYSDFAAAGVTVIPTPIGNQPDAHNYTDIYTVIGKEVRERLS